MLMIPYCVSAIFISKLFNLSRDFSVMILCCAHNVPTQHLQTLTNKLSITPMFPHCTTDTLTVVTVSETGMKKSCSAPVQCVGVRVNRQWQDNLHQRLNRAEQVVEPCLDVLHEPSEANHSEQTATSDGANSRHIKYVRKVTCQYHYIQEWRPLQKPSVMSKKYCWDWYLWLFKYL